MRPVTMYEAEDGKLFRDEEECLVYDRQKKLTEDVLARVKAWKYPFERVEISVRNMEWAQAGEYFFAPDKECREALNYAFDTLGYTLPFVGLTEKSIRVKWDDDIHGFIDYDDFCEDMEKIRKEMN